MMGYWGGGQMMGFGGAAGWWGSLFIIFWVVALIDLILLGMWLWKQLQKK